MSRTTLSALPPPLPLLLPVVPPVAVVALPLAAVVAVPAAVVAADEEDDEELSDPQAARPSTATTRAPPARHVQPRAILAGLLGLRHQAAERPPGSHDCR